MDKLIANHKKLHQQSDALDAEPNELVSASDSHTRDNHNKQKLVQEKQDALAEQTKFFAQAAQQGTSETQRFLGTVERYLVIAKHWHPRSAGLPQ